MNPDMCSRKLQIFFLATIGIRRNIYAFNLQLSIIAIANSLFNQQLVLRRKFLILIINYE